MDDKDTIIITDGSGSSDTLDIGDITIDLGNYGSGGAVGSNYTINSVDTITIDPSWSISSNGASYTTSNYNWVTSNASTVRINEDGIDMNENTDIKFGGRSLKEFMDTMEKRLAILVPDPEKLKHFEALQKAYENYKTLEALCELPKKEDKE